MFCVSVSCNANGYFVTKMYVASQLANIATS